MRPTSKENSSRTGRRSRWLLLSVSVLLALLACEGLLRLASFVDHRHDPPKSRPDAELGWAAAPDLDLSYETPGFGHIDYSTDSNGFRVMGEASSSKTKVVVIGDSFTQAYHVSDGKAYFDFIAGHDDRVELFVYGVGGYSTLQEALALRRYLADIDPDVVIWQFHPNDLIGADRRLESLSGENNNHMMRPYLEAGEVVLRHPDGLLGALAVRSLLFRRIAMLRGSVRKRLGTIENELHPAHPDLQRSLAAMRRTVTDLVSRESQRSFVAFQAPEREPRGYEDYIFSEICKTSRLHCIPGVTEALENARSAGVRIDGGDDPHWNEDGHAIVGRVVLAYLQSNGLLDRASLRVSAIGSRSDAGAMPESRPPADPTETEHLYLSGRGNDDAVTWEFRCSDGRGCGTWTTIEVPSNWELQGFGAYNYGHDDHPSAESGHYRVRFHVPESWRERRVDLVFEGSMTDTEAWLNGRSVGPRHQGGFYRFRYDVGDLLLVGSDNELEVEVHKRSADRSVNRAEREADYWLFGGIFRPVLLAAYPPESIRHAAIDARHDGALAVRVETATAASGAIVTAQVQTLAGKAIGPILRAPVRSADSHTELAAELPGISPWSAEHPNLYQLEIALERGGEIRHRVVERFGFRTVEVRPGHGLYVNGNRTLLKGVNRHSFWPSSGRTTSPRISRDDIEIIRRMNMNAVRSSHYPPDEHFLDLCDEVGLYVIDELAGWHDAYTDEIGARLVRETVTRDVNHPSILLWANGNEGGWNSDLDDLFRQLDPQRRPVIHPDAVAGGFDTAHYLDYDELDSKLTGSSLGERLRGLFGPRPLIMPTELLHGLYDGGGGAALADYWRLLRKSPNAAGAFLWAFLDEAVVRTDRAGALDSDGNHAPDGVVGPYREPEASVAAIREIWSPIVVATESPLFSGRLQIENRFSETDLRHCRFTWELIDYRATGAEPLAVVVGRGSEPGLPLAPGEFGSLDLGEKLPADWRRADILKVTALDDRAREVMTWSFPVDRGDGAHAGPLTEPEPRGDPAQGGLPRESDASSAVTADESADSIVLRAGATRVEIDRASAELRALSSGGAAFPISGGPRPTHGASTVVSLRHYPVAGGHEIEAGFEGALDFVRWRLSETEQLQLEYGYRLSGAFDFFGVTFDLPPDDIAGFRWLGRGPSPVWKNRTAGGHIDLWGSLPSERFACGAYADVAWARIELPGGALILEPASPGLFVSACAPTYPADAGHTAAPAPAGLSFLHAVSAMGTKFHAAEELGPMSRRSRAEGAYRGAVRLRLEPSVASGADGEASMP